MFWFSYLCDFSPSFEMTGDSHFDRVPFRDDEKSHKLGFRSGIFQILLVNEKLSRQLRLRLRHYCDLTHEILFQGYL